MRVLYCIWAVLLLAPAAARAQQPPAAETSNGYTVFLRGTAVGREDVTVRRDADGVTIASTGRLAAPLNIILQRAQVRYRADWTPALLQLDANIAGGVTTLQTSFSDVTALSEGVVNNQQISHTDVGSLRPFVLPNIFFGSYAAIPLRLSPDDVGDEQRAFITPRGGEIVFRLAGVSSERMQTGTETFDVRLYQLLFENPAGPLPVNVYADERGTLLRVNVPSQALDVVREDLAASTARTLVYSNPGDEAVMISARGFNIGATVTRPTTEPPSRGFPAVVLLSGSGANDRDGIAAGVPILGQIAGALADAGFLTVRYDKRGYGQSGGRAESATLSDFAEDARTVIRWLSDRPDVDDDRIAVVGHSEGAWVALLAASREGRIDAVVSIAAPGSTGADLVLEQQRYMLDQLNLPDTERQARIDLQTRINAAVISGDEWEGIPAQLRTQADTPWFQSLLTFDPQRVVDDVDQPVLFLHGALDRQVPVEHVERIAGIARNGDSRSVRIVTVRGVNHLLVPAVTGHVSEYATLQDRNVSDDVTAAITTWLQDTLPPRR